MTTPLKKLGKVGLVACGGGYKVAFTIGVCKYLSSLGIDISLISAVSSSALILATWITESLKTERLEEENRRMDAAGDNFVFNKKYINLAQHLNKNSLFANDGLLAIINGRKDLNMLGINVEKLVLSEIELRIAVRNETTGELEIISNKDHRFQADTQELKLYLQATASPMGLLPPVKIGDSFYSDGMYPDLSCAIENGCDTIFIVETDQPPIPNTESLSWLRRLPYNVSAMYNDVMEKEITILLHEHRDFIVIKGDTKIPWIQRCYKHFASIMASAKRGDEEIFVPHRIIALSPERNIGKLGTLEFAKGDMITALEHGFECAKKAVENL